MTSNISTNGESRIQNVVIGNRCLGGGLELRSCTIAAAVEFNDERVLLVDCIVSQVKSDKPGGRVEYCNVFGGFREFAKPGKGCFSAPPQFADPKNLDYRLMPISPCRGKASDGGDLGCRYTPEMIEILRVALELRRRGIIKF